MVHSLFHHTILKEYLTARAPRYFGNRNNSVSPFFSFEGEFQLKEWECVELTHHKDISKTIEKWQKNGWNLHSYQATGRDIWIKHYLLFEKGE